MVEGSGAGALVGHVPNDKTGSHNHGDQEMSGKHKPPTQVSLHAVGLKRRRKINPGKRDTSISYQIDIGI